MMTSTMPSVVPTGRYSTKETLSILGCSRTFLNKYAKLPASMGGIRFGVRRGNGRRFYTGAEIVRFWLDQR